MISRSGRAMVAAASAASAAASAASKMVRSVVVSSMYQRVVMNRVVVPTSCPFSLTAAFRTISTSVPMKAMPSAVQRDASFAQLLNSDIAHFRSILGDAGVITDADELATYNRDWMRKFHGHSKLVLRPATTQEVSAIMKHCNARKLAVVPQGGNTGLVGGSVPLFDEIVLSLSRMNHILDFNEYSGIVTAESGVILEQLNTWLEQRGFIMPLDLGAKGTCHVGGNVSTNAGGLRYVRYGSLHGSVLGLEVVLADGRIVDMLSTLRKDNTGYDLKQLFIGGEGTLGIITKVSILTPRKPSSMHVAFVGLNSFADVLQCMQSARASLSDILSAVEFLDRDSMDLVLKHIPGARDPLSSPFPFYVLLETSGSHAAHDEEKLQAYLEQQMERGVVQDGTVAQDLTQQKALWVLREHITDSLSKEGTVYKYDISIPVNLFYDMVERMRVQLARFPHARVVGYGHLGDSNLHLNVHTPTYDGDVFGAIEPWLFEQCARERGSVSAEHGLGQSKAKYIGYSKSGEAVELMRSVKQLFDPSGILNPYKLLPPVTK